MTDFLLQRFMRASRRAGSFRTRTVSVTITIGVCEQPVVTTDCFVVECIGGDATGKDIVLSSREHSYTTEDEYQLAWPLAMSECLDALADWRYQLFGCGEPPAEGAGSLGVSTPRADHGPQFSEG